MFICEKGTRAYGAATTFMNYGYKNISYLGGGNTFYKEVIKETDTDTDSKNEKNKST